MLSEDLRGRAEARRRSGDGPSSSGLGIGAKLVLALFGLALVPALSAFVGWSGYRDIQTSTQQAAARHREMIEFGSHVAWKSAVLSSELLLLSRSNSDEELRAREVRIGELTAEIRLRLDEGLSGFHDETDLDTSVAEMLRLGDVLVETVSARLAADRQLIAMAQRLASRLRELSQELEPIAIAAREGWGEDAGSLEVRHHRATQLAELGAGLLRIASVCGELVVTDDVTGLTELRARLATNVHSVTRLLAVVDDAELRREVASVIYDVTDGSDDVRGPFSLKSEALAQRSRIFELESAARRLTVEMDKSSGRMLAEDRKAIVAAEESVDRRIADARRSLLLIAAFSIFVSITIVGTVVYRTMIRRLTRTIDTVRDLSRGKLDVEVTVDGDDELTDMAVAIEGFRETALLALAQQQGLAEQADELRQRNADLEQFAHVASHDLRSPLRAIANLSTWIQEDCGDELPEDSRRYLDTIVDRIKQMNRLLDDLLAYSRASAGARSTARVTVADVVSRAVETLGIPERFTVRCEGEAQAVRTDDTGLAMVLRNLIDNACKHHDRSSGEVAVRFRHDRDRVHIDVTDDGPGVRSDRPEDAFAMFRRFSSTTSGSGIGLALVRRTVESAGGHVRLETGFLTDQRGTRISFDWPTSKPGDHVASASRPDRGQRPR